MIPAFFKNMHILALLSFLLISPALGQQNEKKKDPVEEDKATVEQPELIKGGVSYEPNPDENEGKLREPFKSPFDLEKEREEKRKKARAVAGDSSDRLPYNIGDLSLKGIFYQVEKGYFAIFEVAGEYHWFKVGEKFENGDLVNINDNEVWFKEYIDDGTTEGRIREIVRELHRGEE
ncbi:MAG: hypothetical protein CSA81_06850 [Acidobacteria bacterium]|nr:MAG: hypothetical protein CSA81_06850 [Acidobacteriota bacterium]